MSQKLENLIKMMNDINKVSIKDSVIAQREKNFV